MADREDTKQVGFRLPKKMVGELDKSAAAQSKASGCQITRTDVVRQLLTEALGKKGKK